LLSEKNVTQLLLSVFDEDQMWYLGVPKNIDHGSASHLHINIRHPKAAHAPYPVKLEPNISPLWGETTSTLVSKFLSDLHYNPYPSDKRLSSTVDRNEFKQLFQVQVVVAEIKRRDTLMEWLVIVKIILEAPNHLNNHDIYDVCNMVQREIEDYFVSYVSNYHGKPTDWWGASDQVTSDWHMIIDVVEGLSQNDVPKPPI
jgi:hypothetical protein